VLEELTPAERKKLYGILDSDELSGVFEFVDHPYVYIDELNIRKKVDILSCMDPDKAIACLREMPREQREMLIDLMDEGSRRDIAMVGSIMTTNYIVIQRGSTIKGAMADLISQAAENDNISTIYVTEKDAYYGAIDLKDLIISRENSNLEDIIATSYPYLYAREQIEDCLERIKDYSEDSIPVLSSDNRLLGVVTSQSIVQVVDEELGDDYAKLGGLTAEEDLNEPTIQSIRKRLPWLLILMVLGMVVSGVVGLFEGIMAQLTIIVSFQSLILDMAGNVGTQSLAVTIRVLMDETLTGRQKLELVCKEGRIGLLNGLILGAASCGVVGLYIMLFKAKTAAFAFGISGCIGVALLLAMAVSSIVGTCVPLLFKKLGVDPAVASGPLITTLNDLTAVVAYYGLAWLLLINTFGFGA
jgi:magnesium transporter